jgi:NitT/TauT family transport system permease protein
LVHRAFQEIGIFTVRASFARVDRKLVERVVYLPSVAARVLGNLKVPVGFAFNGASVGEFVAATHRLGYLLSFAQRSCSSWNADLVIAGRPERHTLRRK